MEVGSPLVQELECKSLLVLFYFDRATRVFSLIIDLFIDSFFDSIVMS